MADIKIREVNRGTIKTMDRTIGASRRIKNASIEIKDIGKNQIEPSEQSANEYATSNIQSAGQRSLAFSQTQGEKAVSGATKTFQQAMKEKHIDIKTKGNIAKDKRSANSFTMRSRNAQRAGQAARKNKLAVNRAKRGKARLGAKGIKVIARGVAKSLKLIAVGTKTLVTAIIAGGWIALIAIICCVLFGAALYCFGDESSQNYIPTSPEVEACTPVITKYAKAYGIDEYVELIKAVMMQESGGKGGDPMQASESGYNKKYPREPNGITDPKYSIKCGVQTLASCIKAAGCKHPLDMPRIRLALQGYNYGNGYISWAKKRDGKYTVENATIFSKKQAKKLGVDGYGDRQYPAHVLRFYPYGSYNYGIGNTVITKVAATQLGNVNGKKFWSWYGFGGRQPWCGCFVSWCANQCGYIKSGTIPKFADVNVGARWFKKKGQWQKRGYKPAPGDIIFFDWDANKIINHVGIVEKCNGRTITTIEGNSGNVCRRKTYSIYNGCIVGYGIPKY